MVPCVSAWRSEDIKRSLCTGVLILVCVDTVLQCCQRRFTKLMGANHFIRTNVPHHSFTDPKSPFLSMSWSMTVKIPSTLFTALLAGL